MKYHGADKDKCETLVCGKCESENFIEQMKKLREVEERAKERLDFGNMTDEQKKKYVEALSRVAQLAVDSMKEAASPERILEVAGRGEYRDVVLKAFGLLVIDGEEACHKTIAEFAIAEAAIC